ncbi:heparan sulfate glucosamine 3-O-sulfotransferase 1-like [Glandiceps talaboti]
MFRRGSARGIKQHIRNQHKKLVTLLALIIVYFTVTFGTSLLTGGNSKDVPAISEQRRGDVQKHTGETDNKEGMSSTTVLPAYFPHKARIDPDIYTRVKFDDWCYSMNKDSFSYEKPLSVEQLMSKGCKKRLPDALIIGAKKCGTGPLVHFLSFHPSVAAIHNDSLEAHYYDLHQDNGYEWYRNQLLYTTSRQIVVEKSPQYLTWPHDCSQKVHDYISPKTKIIVVLCDPVQRAVSDYASKVLRPKVDPRRRKHYTFAKTFEKSVIDSEFAGNPINFYNENVDTGIYVKHMIRWLEYFPKEQIYLVDGGNLKNDPYKELHNAEKFLGLAEFVTRDHFYFDEVKRFHCMQFPYKHCVTGIKGGTHPEINEDVLDRLYEFYRPYDKQLSEMFDQKFSWMKKYEEL